jgi:hypothetical protein
MAWCERCYTMLLPDSLMRLLITFGRLRVYLMYDPLTLKPSLFVKLRLWWGLSVAVTVTMSRNFRPDVQLQLATKLGPGFTLTGPEQTIRLRCWHV